MTKKIVIVSPSQGVYGGIEAFVISLANALNAYSDLNVSLCLKIVDGFTFGDDLKHIIESKSIPYSIVKPASFGLFKSIYHADLVHGQNASPDTAVFAKSLGKPLFLTIHNHLLGRPILRRLSWRVGTSLADARTYNSMFVRSTWERDLHPDSLVVPTVSELEFDFAPFEGRKGFIFISRMIPNKGADILLEAYSKLKLDPHLWPLTMVGDGPLLERLRETALKKNLAGVQFLGFVSGEYKVKQLRGAKWLVNPPNTLEDMGLTPLEARANGIPVIASRDGGVPESAGENALFCEPGDVIDLAAQLQTASDMPEENYRMLALKTHETLKLQLRSFSFYMECYRNLLDHNPAFLPYSSQSTSNHQVQL